MARDEAYRIAEQKIEEARRAWAKELDLSSKFYQPESEQLSELPESLGQLTQLESLNLYNNQITVLPESLSQLTQLQSLNLGRNKLTALPESLGQLKQLQTLNLGRNKLTVLPESLGQLTELQSLNLRYNNLTALPQSLSQLKQLLWLDLSNTQCPTLEPIGRLTQLHSLSLSFNAYRALPDSLRGLVRIQWLDLSDNALTTVPEWIGELTTLQKLDLSSNPLVALPDSICKCASLKCLRLMEVSSLHRLVPVVSKLSNLEELNIADCEIGDFPPDLLGLRNLTEMYAGTNGFKSLPPEFGQLSELRNLVLRDNELSDLPLSFLQLTKLESLNLVGNPLNPELAAADKEGLDAIRRYLHELAKGARKRYEAKLLILGDGNEGKTCVSRAIRGLPFEPQVTTRGIDVEQWKFEHPNYKDDADRTITLNIWDFEGQEINHQTHQFFLTTQALYLLVFKCRDKFLMDRAEYWLDTIRARAPKAKVAIVITQCEERTPYVPQDKLHAQYGDLLAEKWLFTVGCGDNSGIVELQRFLERSAVDLEFMGREWPESYSKAEEAIKNKAKNGTTHISRGELYDIFKGCRIDESTFKDVAGAMSTLGAITQFPDCPDLRDFIVLQPQWLTKAISEVMEDKQLASDKGEISLHRMEDIWEQRAYYGMFATFHDCMKEFELCYDLEDASRSCLVPLRFGYEKPAIPWSSNNELRERRVEYKLNIRPPTGLMSRFIVKTHHMMATTIDSPKGVHWHNGVFLSTGAGPLASEALCEFDSDARKLRIQVSAAFPQNLLEQIHGYVKAVFSFFNGLEAQRSYGCIKIDEQNGTEEMCKGVHSESRIYSAIRKQRVLDCEYEFHDVDPQKLIWGFSTFGEYVMAKVASIAELREELDKKPEWAENLTQDIGKLLSWVVEHREKVNRLIENQADVLPEIKQQLELKLHEYLAYTSAMLDDRDYTSAPGLISISTKDQSRWNPASYFKKTYVLTPFCECVGNVHPCEDGQVEFTKDQEWWQRTAPWIARGSKLLTAGLQLAFAGMPLALGNGVFETVKDHVKFMGELTKHMELEASAKEAGEAENVLKEELGDKDLRGLERESRLMRVALAQFLEETAPTNYRAHQWGSLRRVRTSDNSYRWLCESCTNSLKS